MGANQRWRRTSLGRLILFLGSIRFAIPVLVLTAISLIYGSWIEVAHSADDAGRLVYGAWWFVALMALVCAILVLAVVTRYPWRKKHTGFIIVHAALISIIVSAFVSYFTKVEGEIALQEGSSAQAIRTGETQIQLLEHGGGDLVPIESAVVNGPGIHTLDGIDVEIVERWENSIVETTVLDDGLNPLHAVELRFEGDNDEGYWVGQLAPGQQAPVLAGIEIRVLPEGIAWSPPRPEDTITLELSNPETGHRLDSIEIGAPVGEGWTIERIETFAHAMVGEGGLGKGDASRDNPATQITLTHEDGSVERHAAFERFPGSVNKRTLSGESVSSYLLAYVGETLESPTLALTREDGVTTALYASPDGAQLSQRLEGDAPWTLDLGGQACEIMNAFGNARGAEIRVEAPKAEESVPALIVRTVSEVHGQSDPMTLVWGQPVVFHARDRALGLVYAPQTRPVPFTIDLVDFRKQDYPGSEQAMAYESDVVFTSDSGEMREQTIWMNHPLEHKGWKVYQAGFVGGNVSIFQVTRDPGLIPMYLGCTLLCAGILVMYYSRAYSHGHPGMARASRNARKAEPDEDLAASRSESAVPAGDAGEYAAGQREPDDPRELEVTVRVDPDPRSRTHHAHGHLRSASRGRSDRTNTLG